MKTSSKGKLKGRMLEYFRQVVHLVCSNQRPFMTSPLLKSFTVEVM
ncbi:MAG: hypothetical protein WCJ14_03440 [Verrucomicrobiota bacterium]